MFSELVDDINLNTNRGVDLMQTAQFVNSTLRESQSTKGALFETDLFEDVIPVTTIAPFIWTKPIRFRALQAVKYPFDLYPRFIPPGKKAEGQRNFFYAASTYFTFSGILLGETLTVAYYRFTRRFKYYELANRPAVYDFEAEVFTYLPAFDIDDATRENARDLVSSWQLIDWYDTIFAGGVAKVLKRAFDQKSGVAFAEYDAMRTTMWQSLEEVNLAAQSAGQNRPI